MPDEFRLLTLNVKDGARVAALEAAGVLPPIG